MIRSMPRRVWGTPSWVSMKHACTYQPGLAVIVSCWKASCELERFSADELFQSLFLAGQEAFDDLLGGAQALGWERHVHVHEETFVFEADQLTVVQRRRPAEVELDRALRRLRSRQRRGRCRRCDCEARVHFRAAAFGLQCYVLTRLQNRLRFARLTGSCFRVEHDRAVLAGVVRVLFLLGGHERFHFRDRHAGLQLKEDGACFLGAGCRRDDVDGA